MAAGFNNPIFLDLFGLISSISDIFGW